MSMGSLIFTLIASLLVSLIALVGGLLFFRKKKIHSSTALVGFAAGVMLTTAVLELLPEALHELEGEISLLPLFIGIVGFFFLERFVLWFHHHDDPHGTKPTAYLILIGDSIHNFIDGVAIAAAFLIDIRIGILTTAAIAAHEIPQELADLGVLVHSGFSVKKALLFNLFSGLTAVLGAFSGYFILANISDFLPILLLFTAGMFLYISLSDLIPELHQAFSKTSRAKQSLPFIAGCIISILFIYFTNHSH